MYIYNFYRFDEAPPEENTHSRPPNPKVAKDDVGLFILEFMFALAASEFGNVLVGGAGCGCPFTLTQLGACEVVVPGTAEGNENP